MRPVLEGAERSWSPEVFDGRIARAQHAARYEWAAGIVRGKRVLDVGCGERDGTAILARAGAAGVLRLDVSEQAVRRGGKGAQEAADFAVADIRNLPLDSGAVDVVTCFETIEQVADPHRALDELKRVLVPDGILLMSAANPRTYVDRTRYHLRDFTPEELEADLGARFRNVRLHCQQAYVATVISGGGELLVEDPARHVSGDGRPLQRSRPGEELFTVAAASDGLLPELPSLAKLTGLLEVKLFHDTIHMWTERALLAEAEAAAWRTENASARASRDKALEHMRHATVSSTAYEASISWRLTRPLRSMGRLAALARRGSA